MYKKFFRPVILLILPLIALMSNAVKARELTDFSVEITTTKKGAEAKQEAFDRAVEDASHKMTEEFLGAEKTAKVWPQIRGKLLKDSTRYVVFIKGSAPVDTAQGSQVKVQMRISPDHLEAFLREINVLGGGSVRVLPLIVVSDHRGSRYVWWADLNEEKTSSIAQDAFKQFIKQMVSQFKNKSIYVLDPTNASFRMSVPASYRSEGLRREDQVLLAQYLKADVVVGGRIEILRPRLDSSEQQVSYLMEMWQAKTGRNLSEVARSQSVGMDTPKAAQALLEQANPKVMEELSSRLTEAMASGNINLNIVKLSVEGTLSYLQMTEFKKQLSTLREIKKLRERLFEPSRVTFELESSITASELAKSFQKARFSDFRVQVEGSQDDSLVLSVKAGG